MTRSVVVGFVIAVLQTTISVGAMRWAWSRSSFYWVWGAGLLFRLAVLGLTAFVVTSYTELHLVATLLSLVGFTTALLIFESWVFLKPRQTKQNGFSRTSRTSSS
jgi:hypothetical protein